MTQKLLLFSALLLSSLATQAQSLPMQSFENAGGTWSFTSNPTAYNSEGLADDSVAGSEDVWDSIAQFSGGINSAAAGTMFWGGQDLDNSAGGGSFAHLLDFSAVSVSSLSNARISFDYYTAGFDSSDSLAYVAEFDNGSTWGPLTLLNSNTGAWTTVTIPVPSGSSFARLRIHARQNGSSDFMGIDNVRIDTTAGTPAQSGIPSYDIAQVTTSDSLGVADSLGVVCKLTGVVHSLDFDASGGYSLYLYDATGGINVFNFNDVSSYSSPQAGDSIRVVGSIDQFNGLTEIVPDSITVLSTGVSLAAPTPVNTLDETTEGEYITFRGARLISPSQWPSTGNSGNVDVTNGQDTITLRIDDATNIDGTPAPTGVFNVTGAGGQYDFSSPYLEGYQLFPSSVADIDTVAPSSLPYYTIASVTTNDSNLAPDSLGVSCELRGTVYSVDFDGNNGLSLYMYDATGGINVFNFNDPNFYSNVQPGDSIHVFGTIDQYRGLTEVFADSVVLFGRGHSLKAPTVTSTLDETTEGEYVELQGFSLVNASQWPSAGNSATVDVTNGTDTLALRIDSDTDIDGSPAPTTSFDVEGAGSQFTFNNPPNDGYQLYPSSLSSFAFAAPANPTVNFANAQTTVSESAGTIQVHMLINPTSSTQDTITLQAALGANVTTGDGTITPFPNLTTGIFEVGVPANADTASFTINLIDDALLEGNETLFVAIDTVSANLMVGNNRNYTFIIQDNDQIIPTYSIAQVTTNQANGEPDSLGTECKLLGTIFSVDFDATAGYSFYIHDGTGGINVFNFNDKSGYTNPQVGDSVRVIGDIDFYNGLTEIFVDSIALISSGNPIQTPTQVFDLNESTESEFIRLNGYRLVNPTLWPFQGSSQNLDITNGQDTLLMRIDSDTDIDGTMAPTGTFDVIGVGSQFDGSAPYDGGYQIFPRDSTDILPVNLPRLYVTEVMPSSALNAPIDGDWFEITNGSNSTISIQGFSWDDESREAGKHTITTSLQLTSGEAVVVLDAATADVPAWLTEWQLTNTSVQVLNEGNQFSGFSGLSTSGDEVNLYDDGGRLLSAVAWNGASVSGGVSLVYDTTGALTGPSVAGTNGAYTSVNGEVGSPGNQNISLREFFGSNWSLFPNPATEQVMLENATTARKEIRIRSLTGQLVEEISSREAQVRISVGHLPAGTYLITITIDGQQATRKLMVQ